jgi:hypothetical protein
VENGNETDAALASHLRSAGGKVCWSSIPGSVEVKSRESPNSAKFCNLRFVLQTSASLIGGYDSGLRTATALMFHDHDRSRDVHYGQLSRPHDSAFIRAEGLVC